MRIPRTGGLLSLRSLILGLSLLLFALAALVPVALLFSNLFRFCLENRLWTWLIGKDITVVCLESVKTASAATGASLVLALLLGLALGSKKRASVFHLVFFLPLAVPPYITAVCWKGLVEGLAGYTTAARLDSPWAAGIILGFCYFPVLAYMVISGMRGLDSSLEEAGMLALKERTILRKVTLPLLWPQIATGLLLVFLLSITNYAIPSLMGIRTFTVKIYTHFSVFQDISGAIALASPLLLICIVLVVLVHRAMTGKAFFSLHEGRRNRRTLRLYDHAFFKISAYTPPLVVTLVPIFYLIVRVESFSNFKMAASQAFGSIATSFAAAAVSSLLITFLGLLSGYAMERTRLGRSMTARSIFFLPFALPSILLAIGVIFTWNRPGLVAVYHSTGILGFLWAAKYLPLAHRVMADQVRQISFRLEEAAFMSGLSWLRNLTRVVWPLARPGFLTACGITYLFCLVELGGTLLIIPPGANTVPIRLYNLMHYGASSLVAGLGIVLIGLAVAPIGLLVWYGRRSRWS